jgi:diacylglycerol kinase family enzyme
MLKLGIISNPFAKMNKNHPEHNTQMWYTLANHGQYKVTHSLEELQKVCQEFSEKKVNLVGIVGGDGSIGLVLSELAKAYGHDNLPKILLLKGGTINFLASNLNMETSALTCLNDTLFFIKRNYALHETRVDTIDVNGRIGFIFAGGSAVQFLEKFYENKTNTLGAVVTLTKYILDGLLFGKLNGEFPKIMKPQELKIKTAIDSSDTDNKEIALELLCTLIFASTVPSLPLGIRLFKKLKWNKKSAELLAVSQNGISFIVKGIQSLIGIDISNKKNVYSTLFKETTIQGKRNLGYSLDGDLFVADDGIIKIKHGPSFIFCSPYPTHYNED